MNIEFDAYKQKLNEIRPTLEGLADSLNLEGLRNELERLHAMQEAPGFWDNPEKSQQVVVKTKTTQNKIEKYEQMLSAWDDLMTICEMAAEEDDDSMLDELKEGFETLSDDMERCRLQTLLTGTYDSNNAMVSFQAGFVTFLIVHDLIGIAVGFCPTGIHTVEHLTPVLRLGTAGTGLERNHCIIGIISAGKKGLQAAVLHIVGQLLEAFLQLLQHGIVVLFGGHFANGHQIIPGREHLLILCDLRLRGLGLNNYLLAFFWVIPKTGSLLHSMQALQFIFQSRKI